MKKKKGFTLVELLAVIVILAVILVIAVPQIMSVIESARKGSIESTAKLIASTADREYTNRKILGKDTNIECSEVANLNDKDYGTCKIIFDNSGKATVSITGKGKFEGYTCRGNSTNMECIKGTKAETDASYFTYSDVDNGTEIERLKVTVKDKNKCTSYIASSSLSDTIKESTDTLCAGDTDANGNAIQNLVYYFDIPSGDYETAGLNVEWITINNVKVKDKDKCTLYIASSSLNDTIKANVDTLCTGGKTTDGDTMQNLVVFDNILSSDYETAGLEIDYIKVEDVVVKDKDKCVNYHITSAFLGYTEEDADTICSGNATGGWTIRDNVLEGDIPSSDYETAGLEVTSKPYAVEEEIIITGYNSGFNVEIIDQEKCKVYINSLTKLGETLTDSTTEKLCTGGTYFIGDIAHYVSNNNIPKSDYALAGLEVTYKNGGGTDVVIPSMIDGKKVVEIGSGSFREKGLTSVIIPNTVTNIGDYAFAYNQLKEVIIPSSVTSISLGAFYDNQLTSVIFPETGLFVGCSAFGRNAIDTAFPDNVSEDVC